MPSEESPWKGVRGFIAAGVALILIAVALLLWPSRTGTLPEEQAAIPAGEAPATQPAVETQATESQPTSASPQPQAASAPPPSSSPAATRPATAAQPSRQPPAPSSPRDQVTVVPQNVQVRQPETAFESGDAPAPPTITIGASNPALGAVANLPARTPALRPVSRSELVPAKLLQQVRPTYPQAARQTGVQGAVVLDVTIGADGSVRQVEVVSGHPLLVQSAADAVRRWRYSPSILNGVPTEATTRVTIQFNLPAR